MAIKFYSAQSKRLVVNRWLKNNGSFNPGVYNNVCIQGK